MASSTQSSRRLPESANQPPLERSMTLSDSSTRSHPFSVPLGWSEGCSWARSQSRALLTAGRALWSKA
jgi:hypothetical protein